MRLALSQLNPTVGDIAGNEAMVRAHLARAREAGAQLALFPELVVTNVPGPQIPLYLLGRHLQAFYPVVPLAHHQALGIAIMSYDGRLGFGLLGDYDALPDLEQLATDVEAAIAALSGAAGVTEPPKARKPAPEAAKV